jgi:hypothetical protein
VPIAVLAPGRFSTTWVSPVSTVRRCPKARAFWSRLPPGGAGTTMRTTRASSARATGHAQKNAAISKGSQVRGACGIGVGFIGVIIGALAYGPFGGLLPQWRNGKCLR